MFCGLNSRRAQDNAVRLRTNLGQTEIENLRLTSLRSEDVRWFDVTVNDPLRVCSIEGIGNLDGKIEHRFNFHRLAGDPVPQGLTF